jgi:putative endonuclease
VAGVGKRAVGFSAERIASRYLGKHGVTVVERNFQCRLGEIDIVATDGQCLAFIEVRYRGPGSYSRAAPTVDRAKQSRLIRTAAMYLARNQSRANQAVRFDVVAIDAEADGSCRIDWIRDAFRPGDARL